MAEYTLSADPHAALQFQDTLRRIANLDHNDQSPFDRFISSIIELMPNYDAEINECGTIRLKTRRQVFLIHFTEEPGCFRATLNITNLDYKFLVPPVLSDINSLHTDDTWTLHFPDTQEWKTHYNAFKAFLGKYVALEKKHINVASIGPHSR